LSIQSGSAAAPKYNDLTGKVPQCAGPLVLAPTCDSCRCGKDDELGREDGVSCDSMWTQGLTSGHALSSKIRKVRLKYNAPQDWMGSVAGPAIQATGKSIFEDSLRAGGSGSDFTCSLKVRTKLPVGYSPMSRPVTIFNSA
jgi:hypothetical protein